MLTNQTLHGPPLASDTQSGRDKPDGRVLRLFVISNAGSTGKSKMAANSRARVWVTSFILAVLCLAVSAVASPLTPEKLILAPRPSADLRVSPNKKYFGQALAYASLSDSSVTNTFHVYRVPREGQRNEGSDLKEAYKLHGISYAAWLDDSRLVFVNGSTLHVASIESRRKPRQLIKLPAPIAADSLRVVGKGSYRRLIFSADVYSDGRLEGVPRVETAAHEEEWSRVKGYDADNGAFFRHWDVWNRPGKRSNLFSLQLSHDRNLGWALSTDTTAKSPFVNLLNGTSLASPIPPFGGKDHWDANEDGVVFVSKTPGLPEVWHTKTDVYHVHFNQPGQAKQLSNDEHGAISSPRFSPDGHKVAWLEMAIDGYESDRRTLQIFDLEDDKQHSPLADWDRSPSSLSWSTSGKQINLLTEDYQRERLFTYQLGSDEPAVLNKAVGSLASLTPLDDRRALVVGSTLRTVNEVSLLSEKALRPLTSFSSALKRTQWGPRYPEAFKYTSADGEERWGWIHYPPGYPLDDGEDVTSKKWSLLILIHGGPEGAWTESWSTRWNPEVFAAAGHLVVTLNPTGSTGFGEKYQTDIINDWGGKPYRDLISGVHHILEREASHIDPDRVAAAGASYGGYMINWIQGHNDDSLFKALVCHDGVFNTINTYLATDELWFPTYEFGNGAPWDPEAREVYLRNSPEAFTDRWQTPQLVIHGARDWRLVPSEGISAFNVLRRRQVESRLVYFEKEGHQVFHPRDSLRWHREVLGWVERFVGSGPREPADGGDNGTLAQSAGYRPLQFVLQQQQQ